MSGANLHVRVTGMVQGVGFRWFVRERARRLGISGWVRNVDDGSVEIMAAGDPGQLELLRRELEQGPRGARVEAVIEIEAQATEPLEAPFGILR
jgi:acylphosphatase